MTARLGLVATVAVSVVVVVFVVLAGAISNLQRRTVDRRDAQVVTVVADALQKSVLDLETGVHAFVITRQDRFLGPWRDARGRLAHEKRLLVDRIGAGSGSEADAVLARRIGDRVDGYVHEYSLPLVGLVRSRRLQRGAVAAQVAEGKQRVDELRGLFEQLLSRQAGRAAAQDAAAGRAARRAVVVGVGGLVLILAILLAGLAYLARNVTTPVVRVAEAARTLAAGRRGRHERVSSHNAHAAHEIRSLTESFDAMAEVLHDQRERLRAHNALLERRVRERTADLEQAHYEALLMLAVAAEYRDHDTDQHTRRVGRNAGLIAAQLGLSAQSIELIEAAALLHDVGKIGIADAIMLKPGRLSPDEFRAMKQHVEIGASILGSSTQQLFHIASQIALTHHERWDGSGYPRGLAGDEIPLAGRIVAVIDVFDALTHPRPYKQAWPVEHALAEVRRGAGSHFDPDVVAALEAIDPDLLLAKPSDRAAHEQRATAA